MTTVATQSSISRTTCRRTPNSAPPCALKSAKGAEAQRAKRSRRNLMIRETDSRAASSSPSGGVSPLGSDVRRFGSGLIAGESGIGPVTRFDTTNTTRDSRPRFKGFGRIAWTERKSAGPICLSNTRWRHRPGVKQAVWSRGERGSEPLRGNRRSGIGGIATFEDQHAHSSKKVLAREPLFIPMMISDWLRPGVDQFGAKGPNYCTVSACSSGAHAWGRRSGSSSKRGGRDDLGGRGSTRDPGFVRWVLLYEGRCPHGMTSAERLRAPSTPRDGFVMGKARVSGARGARGTRRTWCEILCGNVGYGATGDAYHMTAPRPRG